MPPSHDQHSGKSKSIAASVATGGKGTVAYARPKPVLDTKNEPAQFISGIQTNKKTGRTFKIIQEEGYIEAEQIDGDKDDVHNGYLIYEVTDKDILLKTIQSTPEIGTGIGSLLMLALAEVAMTLGKPKISIGLSSLSAVGFYELLGFRTDMPVEVKAEEDRLMDGGSTRGDALMEYAEYKAKAAYDSNKENRKAKRRFEALDIKVKEKLILTKLNEMQAPSKNPGKNLRDWVHAKAAAPRGFSADPAVVANKAASQCKYWVDDKGSGVGLDVKLDETKATGKGESKTASTVTTATTTTATTTTATTTTATTATTTPSLTSTTTGSTTATASTAVTDPNS